MAKLLLLWDSMYTKSSKGCIGFRRLQLFSLCIDPSMRGKGTVLTIINESLKELKNNNVKVVNGCIDAHNKQSLAVHQRFGFRIVEKNNKLCGPDTYKIELTL